MPISKRTSSLTRRPTQVGVAKPDSTARDQSSRIRIDPRPSVAALRAVLPANQRWMVAAYGD
ncbi:MAG: hypothetical protein QF463_16205 [Vicinamibacterales bacterium]|jgi:hypothetical protein|nr:hypothetical protein [Acidobacteriota bacterium]MDP6374134.1 hypothetical protein [Vicinamibacterales bacterium]MDP6610609.1 hypothetical protein [Vicinamibacterales bacterium]HAK56997.1 hypothetical protein [Acidobacteriota bacterium]